ncbi:MAG: hypothetical protein GF411_20125 [Candidatus Lokiarchaeota archaeon]|nr:hypothetical protein [Candidatus Lokiarchaeota archaeon]
MMNDILNETIMGAMEEDKRQHPKVYEEEVDLNCAINKSLGLSYTVKHYDKDGNLKSVQKGGNSLVRNFATLIGGLFRVGQDTVDSGIVDFRPGYPYDSGGATSIRYLGSAPAGWSNYGIVVGSDSTAVDPTDSSLGSKYTNGAGSGNLVISSQSHDAAPTVGASTITFSTERSFRNDYGSSQDVNEIGLMGGITYSTSSSSYLLFAHDIITTVSLGSGETIVVEYTFTVSESEGMTKNWGYMLWGLLFNETDSSTVKNTSNSFVSNRHYNSSDRYLAWFGADPGTDTGVGPVVGSDDTTMSMDDYNLGSELTTLDYGSYTKPTGSVASVSGSESSKSCSRVFTNNTGGNVTIKEVGLIISHYDSPGGGDEDILVFRKVLGSPVTLSDGDTYALTWKMKVTA